jgi:hypothetical protein
VRRFQPCECPLNVWVPRRSQAVEKLSVAVCGPRFGIENARFQALKPDSKSSKSIYAAVNDSASGFSTA